MTRSELIEMRNAVIAELIADGMDEDDARFSAMSAAAGEFKVADGYMVVAVLNGEMFARLARAVGRDRKSVG